jgi:hypothetical protein
MRKQKAIGWTVVGLLRKSADVSDLSGWSRGRGVVKKMLVVELTRQERVVKQTSAYRPNEHATYSLWLDSAP